ncbi:vitamin K epoxide reductase family protein [Microbacterium kyungheense]|uniref:Putative membrane protein n=1 Tax=Microbacterium kyungheense TaxID=1263636 RepID=A0A543F2X6_9MICO|nr:vitamin K epoxide reductase family protein [Microbacterium kyungheense]TQM28155.1 putative membrane protein [Microbacterium kyungheense]
MVTSPAERPEARTHYALALVLIVGGLLGLLASFALTMDDINLLKNPETALTCNVNAVVNCGKNIESWQGSVFGFPNPILGLMMFPAPVVVGFALLARARFAGWFWWIFNAGLLFAISFVYWLAFQSIFDIGTLCPWCSLVYLVTIPMFLAVTVRNLRAGLAGRALQKVGDAIAGWVPLIAIAGYVIIFGAAQLHLNILATLF